MARTTPQRIATIVRDARTRQGIDQRKLALIANVGVSSVHRVESGEETVRLDVLIRILTALGLEMDVGPRR
jgi:y4mF family transcriptional regulator